VPFEHSYLSTAPLADDEKFEFWREECMLRVMGISVDHAERETFSGDLSIAASRSVVKVHMNMQAGPYRLRRTAAEMSRVGWAESVFLIRPSGGHAEYRQTGRAPDRVGVQELLLADPTAPSFGTGMVGQVDVWMLPRALIEPHLPAGRGPIWQHISSTPGINQLIWSYHAAITEQMDSLSEIELAAVVDNFCRLIAIGCGSAAQEQPEALRASQLEELKRFIHRHLARPDLTPAKVADAHHISVRKLHRLFESSGMSFSQYVLARRLDECHAALVNSSAGQRSVADIALGWGFNSLPTFYRAFARRFGRTPRDVTASAKFR
jgi:AraC-like DNA-binding protein